MEYVTREMLEKIAGPLVVAPASRAANGNGHAKPVSLNELDTWIATHHIETRGPYPYDGGRKWELVECPFCKSHDGVAIFEQADGRKGFKCHHNRCKGKQWQDFRSHYEPSASTNTPQEKGTPASYIDIDAAITAQDMTAVIARALEVARLNSLERARMKLKIKEMFGVKFPMREFEEVMQEERRKYEAEKRRRPTIKSARALLAQEFAAIKWVVKGILPPGLIALAGKQKIGKSWFDYHIALAVSFGGNAFGSIPVEEGDVLYMALEDNDRRVHDRLLTCVEMFPEGQRELSDRLDIVTEWPRMDEIGLLALEDWITSKQKPRLIIIDPWVKVKPRIQTRAGETGYDNDYEALNGLKALADKYQVCILVQFHLRKAEATDPFDELNGTSGITACADGSLFLKRPRGEKLGTLWGTGRDYGDDVNLAVSFDAALWTIVGDAETVARGHASQEVLDVLLAENKPMFPKEIAAILCKPEGTIRKRLFDMKERGEVQDTGHGYRPTASKTGNAGNAQQYEDRSGATSGPIIAALPLTTSSNALQYDMAPEANVGQNNDNPYVTLDVTLKGNVTEEGIPGVTSESYVTRPCNADNQDVEQPVEHNDIAERYKSYPVTSHETHARSDVFFETLSDKCAYCEQPIVSYTRDGIPVCEDHAQEKGY